MQGCTIRRYRRTAIGALIGDRLRSAREKRKMMGKYVAKKLGVSPATYSQIESGQRDLTVQRLDTIRSILGLTWEQLLAEEDGKNGGLPATFCQEPATFCPEPATFGQESGIFVRGAPREARQGKG